MRLSSRETTLAWLTMAVLLGGATYFFGRGKLEEWSRIRESKDRLVAKIERSERLVGEHDHWRREFDRNITVLQSFPAGQNVSSKIRLDVSTIAKAQNLQLNDMKHNENPPKGDVHEMEIMCNRCTGDLEAWIRLLYELQRQGGNYRIRYLDMKPAKKGENLDGKFTLDCAFTWTGPQANLESTLEVTPVAATP